MAAGGMILLLLATCIGVAACLAVSPSKAGVGDEDAAKGEAPIFLPGHVPVSFEFASLLHNNLGYEGPDGGEPTLHFTNVSFVNGMTVDLVVSVNDKKYFAKNHTRNGLSKPFGMINVHCGVDSFITFSFYDHDTMRPVKLGQVYLSFFDVDSGGATGLVEYVGFEESEAYYLTKTTELKVENTDHATFWSSTTAGTGADNPKSISGLTPQQKDRTVTGLFENHSTVVTHIGVDVPHGSQCPSNGRNVMFAFDSPLVSDENEIKTKPECLRLDFEHGSAILSNLGGQGPQFDLPSGLEFTNVAMYGGENVNLHVDVIGGAYTPGNASRNGLIGGIANINGACGSETRLQFQLTNSLTGSSVNVPRLCVSFLDLDTGISGNCAESITVGGFSDLFVPPGTKLSVADVGAGKKRVVAGSRGQGSDNPTNETKFSEDRTVDLEFADVSGFTATLAWGTLPDGWPASGRNIMFSGSAGHLQ